MGPHPLLKNSAPKSNLFARSGLTSLHHYTDHPPRLPPLRAVNHTIPLVNPDVPYSSRPPRCSAALFPLLREKTQHYVQAGWWEPAHGKNAAPLLAIPKTGAELKLRD